MRFVGFNANYVRDKGAGLDPQYEERLFRPFRRLNSKQEFEGTGIGLSIVEQIIRRPTAGEFGRRLKQKKARRFLLH